MLFPPILLVFASRSRMTNISNESGPTSNDLLRTLMDRNSDLNPQYEIVAQSAEEVQSIDNAPAISMGPYLLKSGKSELLTVISVYSLRGETRDQVRLLYLNSAAMKIWKQMGKTPTVIGARFRPPVTAILAFGVPFSE